LHAALIRLYRRARKTARRSDRRPPTCPRRRPKPSTLKQASTPTYQTGVALPPTDHQLAAARSRFWSAVTFPIGQRRRGGGQQGFRGGGGGEHLKTTKSLPCRRIFAPREVSFVWGNSPAIQKSAGAPYNGSHFFRRAQKTDADRVGGYVRREDI
jgi:hypothetical protein